MLDRLWIVNGTGTEIWIGNGDSVGVPLEKGPSDESAAESEPSVRSEQQETHRPHDEHTSHPSPPTADVRKHIDHYTSRGCEQHTESARARSRSPARRRRGGRKTAP